MSFLYFFKSYTLSKPLARNMKKYFILLILFLTPLVNSIYPQVHQDWVARYDYSNQVDVALAIAVDSSGNVYVTGESGFPSDIATIKYNSLGIQEWVARYNGPGSHHDVCYAIDVDLHGNVYVTGATGSPADIIVIKYNHLGVQQWVKTYNGPHNYIDYAYSIAVDNDGNVYVGGTTTWDGVGRDFVTIKLDSIGITQWVTLYGEGGFTVDVCFSLKVDQAGNVFVTGFGSGGSTMSDYKTIKYDSAGIQQWVSTYNGPMSRVDQAWSMVIDEFSNVYVTGQSEGIGTNNDYATVKYNSDGEQQWVARYNDTANLQDIASSIAVDTFGNVYVTGKSRSDSGNYETDYATIKYNPSGEEQWVVRYEQAGREDHPPLLVTDVNNNVYITGNCGSSPFSYDYATIKYNTLGVEQWVTKYNGPQDSADYAFAIAVDAKGNVYVTGTENNYIFTNSIYATIKYSQTIVNTSISAETPEDYNLYQNYPNPFNPTTKIRYQIQKSEFVKLTVFNILGNEIESLVNQRLQPGIFEVKWDASKYSSGTYFYRLTAGDFSEIRKMLLIK